MKQFLHKKGTATFVILCTLIGLAFYFKYYFNNRELPDATVPDEYLSVVLDGKTMETIDRKLSNNKVEPFQPDAAYESYKVGIYEDLGINRLTKEALKLSDAQWARLCEDYNNFLKTAGEIQAEDAYVGEKADGTQIVYLKPVPEKWTTMRQEFRSALDKNLGKAKSAFFQEKSKQALEMITGDFGHLPRSIEIADRRFFNRVSEGNPHPQLSGPDWSLEIRGSANVPGIIKWHFPPNQRDIFKDKGTSQAAVSGFISFKEDNIPSFLKPLILLASDSKDIPHD